MILFAHTILIHNSDPQIFVSSTAGAVWFSLFLSRSLLEFHFTEMEDGSTSFVSGQGLSVEVESKNFEGVL